MRGMLTPLIAVAVVCGVTSHAHAQSAAPKAGKVARILVEKGTAVQAGEGLIELD